MSLHDQRDWDTRLGNILYSAFIVTVAVRELMGSDYFWRVSPLVNINMHGHA